MKDVPMGEDDAIGAVLLAALAGFLGYVTAMIETGKKIKWIVAVSKATGSGLLGYLVFLVGKAFAISPDLIGAIVGMSGWLGADVSVKLIEKVIGRRLGIADENLFTKPYKEPERRQKK